MRALMARAVARGELRSDALARFPQLLIAPGLVAIVWRRAVRAASRRSTCASSCAPISISCSAKGARHDRRRIAVAACASSLPLLRSPAATTARRRPSRAGSRPISFSSAPTRPAASRRSSVREGDQVTLRAPLFSARFRPAAGRPRRCRRRPSRTRSRPTIAPSRCCKTNAGTQKALEDAEAALRTAQARLNSSQTRLTRRKMFSPVEGTVAADLLPGRRDGAGGPAGGRDPAARQSQGALLRQRGDAAADQDRRHGQRPLRRLPAATSPPR